MYQLHLLPHEEHLAGNVRLPTPEPAPVNMFDVLCQVMHDAEDGVKEEASGSVGEEQENKLKMESQVTFGRYVGLILCNCISLQAKTYGRGFLLINFFALCRQTVWCRWEA